LYRTGGALLRRDARVFFERLGRGDAFYAGKPLPTRFYPYILSRREADSLGAAAEGMLAIIEKATRIVLADEALARFFALPRRRMRLIRHDPGYPRAVPCARFDSLPGRGYHKFIELNTDGTSGMTNVDEITRLYAAGPSLRRLLAGRDLGAFDVAESVWRALMECWRGFGGTGAREDPTIAVVDWAGVGTGQEFEAFAKLFRKKGCRAIVADPRELSYKWGKLRRGTERIDLVYRRVVSAELARRLDDVGPFIRSYLDGAVCVVGSFRSDLAHSKKMLAFLSDERHRDLFAAGERRLIDRHIPWTRKLIRGEALWRGEKRDLIELARRDRASFVVKPAEANVGRGVVVGRHADEAQWRRAIERGLRGGHVIQEFVPGRGASLGLLDPKFALRRYRLEIGAFLFGGRFSGVLARATSHHMIKARREELTLPVLVCKKSPRPPATGRRRSRRG